MRLFLAAIILAALLTALPTLLIAAYLAWQSWAEGWGAPVDLTSVSTQWFNFVVPIAIATVPISLLVAVLAWQKRLRPIIGGVVIVVLICAALCTWMYFRMAASSDSITRSYAGLAVLYFYVGVGTIVPIYGACYLFRRPLGLTPILGL
jgi:TRAP-type C4-dicarboxylate transport system permease small subunit